MTCGNGLLGMGGWEWVSGNGLRDKGHVLPRFLSVPDPIYLPVFDAVSADPLHGLGSLHCNQLLLLL